MQVTLTPALEALIRALADGEASGQVTDFTFERLNDELDRLAGAVRAD